MKLPLTLLLLHHSQVRGYILPASASLKAYSLVYSLIISSVGVTYVIFVLEETRGETILSKRAIRLSKETGRQHTTEFDIANSSRSVIAALKTRCVHSNTSCSRGAADPSLLVFVDPSSFSLLNPLSLSGPCGSVSSGLRCSCSMLARL